MFIFFNDKHKEESDMRKYKRALSLLLSMIMVLGMFTVIPFTASAEEDPDNAITTWAQLQERINNAANGTTITLTADLTAEDGDTRLLVSGKSVTLDLNGHKLDRNLIEPTACGSVICVESGTLTVIDNSGDNSGMITGGCADYDGGGILIESSGTLNFMSGSITGNNAVHSGGGICSYGTVNISGGVITRNTADTGGGIGTAAELSSTISMTGGTVTGNTATFEGGGIYCTGTANLSGGVISFNESEKHGGGICNFGTMDISGGTVHGNYASENGGGIVNFNTLNLTGGTISGNFADGKGGGIFFNYFYGTAFNVSGSPIVADNGNGNVYLESSRIITVNGTLNSDARIDISADNLPRVVTSGLGVNSASAFTFASGGTPATIENGEIVPDITSTVTVGTWAELKDAVGTNYAVIALSQDITNPGSSGSDVIKISNKTVTIDLMGHSLNRNRTFGHSDGHVIWADGSANVTIRDTIGGGVLTGGWANRGGGINVGSNATVKLYNVTVSGNHGEDEATMTGLGLSHETAHGGGVFVHGTLYTYGAVIKDNEAFYFGGGICSGSDAKLYLNGTVIANNTALTGGGLSLDLKDSTSTISNCLIEGNKTKLTNELIQDSGKRKGAGIYLDAENRTLKVTGSAISCNTSDIDGGGVYVNKGKMDMTGSTVSGNTADDGGGFFNEDGTIDLNYVDVVKNDVNSEDGGGIVNKNKANIKNSNICFNTANTKGGGIWNSGNLTLTDCNVNYNTSNNEGGGGIYNDDGNITITGGEVSYNNAKTVRDEAFGGGLCVMDGTVTATGTDFIGNYSKNNGGAMYLNDGGTLSLIDVTVSGNHADAQAGGIRKGGDSGNTLKFSGKIIVSDNSAHIGNDVFLCSDKNITIAGTLSDGTQIGVALESSNRVFTNNFKSVMGANADPCDYFFAEAEHSVWKDSSGEAKLMDSDWSILQKQFANASSGDAIELQKDWKAESFDEHLVVDSGKSIILDLMGHTINAQKKLSKSIIDVKGTLTVIDSVGGGSITGGSCNRGGAIYVFSSGTFNLEGGSITGNTASTEGGGIHSVGTVNIRGGAVSDNSVTGAASGNNGGGIWSSGTLTITGGTITKNSAGYDGGGIYTTGATDISGGTISNNTARLSGGAVRIQGGTTEVSGGTFSDNTATSYHGGAIYLGDGILNLFGGSVTGNTAGMEGGAILYGSNATLNVKGAPFVTGNNAPQGKNIYLRSTFVINVTGALDNNAVLDVAAQQTGRKLTSGLSGKGSLSNFTYNEVGDSAALELKDNEVYIPAVAADITVSTWEGLQEAMSNADNQGRTIALTCNLDGKDKACLLLEGSDKNITIDLAGYSLNKNQSSKGDNKHVIEAKDGATLTIKDTLHTGVIKGGWADNGGGVYVNEGSTVNLQHVTVRDNKAGSDGGGIYVKGTLNMTGGAIIGNTAGDNGGGIYCSNNEGVTITLNSVKIDYNTSKHAGGGLNIHVKDNTSTITSCTISGNVSKSGSGGGLVFNQSGKIITLNNNTISNNTADDNGGGIFVDAGTVKITGENSRISGNRADNGGGIAVNATLKIEAGSIENNSCDVDGGGIYTKGTTEISGGSVSENTAKKSGGGIRVKGGTATVTGGEINSNTADEHGGGIYCNNDCIINLYGGSVRYNRAEEEGSGVLIGGDVDEANIKGKPVIQENDGEDIFLRGSEKLTVTGTFERGASVGVSLEKDDFGKKFTKNYGSNNTEAPDQYIFSCDGYAVDLKDGEVIFKADTSTKKYFIPRNSQIKTTNLNSKNWMAGISGERTLNEISIPCAHDSGTKNLSYANTLGSFGMVFAYTQREYVDTLMDMGTRWFDIRLNNYKPQERVFWVSYKDDGKNLYLCHGKADFTGSIYCEDRDGSKLKFSTILKWAEEFLEKHPTETLLFSLTAETKYSKDINKIMDRADEHLRALTEKINPSTGESYVYWEDGKVGQNFTRFPKLKDCRGKMVFMMDGNAGGTIRMNYINGIKHYRQGGSAGQGYMKIISNLNTFYREYGGVPILTNAADHYDFIYQPEYNGYDIPFNTPLEVADYVNPQFLKKGKRLDQHGEYFGWVVYDSCNKEQNKIIYESNFYDAIEYRTVKAKSGLNNDAYPDQTFTVLKGTPITIPENIYNTDTTAAGGRYFVGWRADDRLYRPGETYTIDGDVTFTAEWSTQVNTTLRVEWKDGDDNDELRPDTLTLKINGLDNVTVTVNAANNWTTNYNGNIDSVTSVWENSSAYICTLGTDNETGTTVVTLTHTPADKITPTVTVTWDDGDNEDGIRPDNVTLHLLENGTEKASKIVSAADNWKWSLGELPVYKDGEKVEYTITEDDIVGNNAEEDYSKNIDGFSVTNTHSPTKNVVSGTITWLDSEDSSGQRPDSVTLNLHANGEIVETKIVTQDAYGDWLFEFDVTELKKNDPDVVLSVTEDELPGYSCTLDTSGDYFDIQNEYTAFSNFKGHSLTLKGDIGVNFYVALSPDAADKATISFKWYNKKLNDVSVEYDDDKGFYRASCPIAVAEMTYDITATLTIDGENVETNIYSATKYANVILTSETFKTDYISETGQEKYDQLTLLVKTMLDYGAQAQETFDRNTEILANKLLTDDEENTNYYYVPEEVTPDMITTEPSDMTDGLEQYGLEYAGTTIVYLTETSMRHYYMITDEELFNAVKNEITFGGVNVTCKEKGSQIYFEYKGIPAKHLGTLYTLSIGTNEYQYSVLDYVRACLKSSKVSENTKLLVAATYRYNEAAKAYFG